MTFRVDNGIAFVILTGVSREMPFSLANIGESRRTFLFFEVIGNSECSRM